MKAIHPVILLAALAVAPGCSLRTYAVNMVGDALASGNSVYETDDDLELVRTALPFGLKLTESLLAQSPRHPGLLLTACRGFVSYAYAYVDHDAAVAAETDLDAARAIRQRARRLYMRAFGYCMRGLERTYPGFAQAVNRDAVAAAALVDPARRARDLPFLYWAAAALGLAISASTGDAAMLARLPDVKALLDRALALDETWGEGALHEFKIVLANATPGEPDVAAIRSHYERAVQLSRGRSAGVHLLYAEAVAVPLQKAGEFRAMIRRALAVDPDEHPPTRLVNLLAHRRARWLESRADELILASETTAGPEQRRIP